LPLPLVAEHTEEMLEAFALESRPETLRAEAERVYGDAVDRLTIPLEHVDALE